MDKNKIREALEVGLNYVLNAGYSRHKDDEEKEIREALAELDTDDWIKVTDRLPEVAESVMVATDAGDVWTAWVSCIKNDPYPTWHSADEIEGNITHWQPLPSNPKE